MNVLTSLSLTHTHTHTHISLSNTYRHIQPTMTFTHHCSSVSVNLRLSHRLRERWRSPIRAAAARTPALRQRTLDLNSDMAKPQVQSQSSVPRHITPTPALAKSALSQSPKMRCRPRRHRLCVCILHREYLSFSLSLSLSITLPLKWHFTLTPYSRLRSFHCLTSALLLFFSDISTIYLSFSHHIYIYSDMQCSVFVLHLFSLFVILRFKSRKPKVWNYCYSSSFLPFDTAITWCLHGFCSCPVGTFLSETRLSVSLMLS